jgi:hypothetical protein
MVETSMPEFKTLIFTKFHSQENLFQRVIQDFEFLQNFVQNLAGSRRYQYSNIFRRNFLMSPFSKHTFLASKLPIRKDNFNTMHFHIQ